MTEKPLFLIPEDRYYLDEHHMWAKLASDNRVVVGIDTLGLESLGDLAYVSLEKVGTEIKAGDSIGAIEAAKMTGDLISPVSGTIVKTNSEIVADPSIVNNDPYEAGWMVEIETQNWEVDNKALVSGEGIPAWVSAEIDRYRLEGWID